MLSRLLRQAVRAHAADRRPRRARAACARLAPGLLGVPPGRPVPQRQPGPVARVSGRGPSLSRLRQISNAVDTERFRPAVQVERDALRRELGLPDDVPIVLFVGFFSRDKRPSLLYEAWAPTAADSASQLLFIGATRSGYREVEAGAGGHDSRARLSQPAWPIACFSSSRVTRLNKYFSAVDLYVLPSVREGFPIALLEAMSSGLPCIATRLPGSTDVDHRTTESTACWSSPTMPTRFAPRIRSVLSDPRPGGTAWSGGARDASETGFRSRARLPTGWRPTAIWSSPRRGGRSPRHDTRSPTSSASRRSTGTSSGRATRKSCRRWRRRGTACCSSRTPASGRRSVRDLPRVRQRIRNWWRGTKGFREERPNLFVYSPHRAAAAVFAAGALDQPLRCCCERCAAGCARPASTGRSSGRSCRRRSRSI